jgi:hypothetical protein
MHPAAALSAATQQQQQQQLRSQHVAVTELDARLSELLTLRQQLTVNAVTAEAALQAVAEGTTADLSNPRLKQQYYGGSSSISRRGSSGCYSSCEQPQQQVLQVPVAVDAVAWNMLAPAPTTRMQQQQQQQQQQQLCSRSSPRLTAAAAAPQHATGKSTAAAAAAADLCPFSFCEIRHASSPPKGKAGPVAVPQLWHPPPPPQQQQQQWSAAAGSGGWRGDSAGELDPAILLSATEQRFWQLEELQEVRFDLVTLSLHWYILRVL